MHDSELEDGTRYGTVDAKLHPKFLNLTIYDDYDMAIITLDRQIQFNKNVRPICLPSPTDVFVGQSGIVAGWGALEEGVPNGGIKLQEVRIRVKSNEECRHDLRKIADFNDESMICGYEVNKDACQVRRV